MTLGGDVDFQQIAKKTPGFVGADLSSLTKEAAVVAINRIFTRLRASPESHGATSSAADTDAIGRSNNEIFSNGAEEGGAHASVGNNTAAAAVPGAVSKEPKNTDGVSSQEQQQQQQSPEDVSAMVIDQENPPTEHQNKATGAEPREATSAAADTRNKSSTPDDDVAAAAEGGADAVGGFLAGPLSPAQLAPLSVTMQDFMAAVKKVCHGR